MDQNFQQELNYLIEIASQLDRYVKVGLLQKIQIPGNVALEKKIPLKYTSQQFFNCFFNLLNEVTQNQQKLTNLKDEAKTWNFKFQPSFANYRDQFILKNFFYGQEQMIQVIDCKLSIFESFFLKIFLSKNPEFYIQHLLESTLIDRIQYGFKLEVLDIQLIRRIVYSNKVKPLIRKLNEIYFQKQKQSEVELDKEIDDLLILLSNPFFISEANFYGLTCLNGKLIYNSEIVNYQDQGKYSSIYRALLIITCIHEVFFHLKRITYCNIDDVLQSTPSKYSATSNESENPEETGEAGEYFEYNVFHNVIELNNCTYDLANAILTPENWENDNFYFWNLVTRHDSPGKQHGQDSSLLKQGSQVMSPPSKKIQSYGCCSRGKM